jgi:hypothetical protein
LFLLRVFVLAVARTEERSQQWGVTDVTSLSEEIESGSFVQLNFLVLLSYYYLDEVTSVTSISHLTSGLHPLERLQIAFPRFVEIITLISLHRIFLLWNSNQS